MASTTTTTPRRGGLLLLITSLLAFIAVGVVIFAIRVHRQATSARAMVYPFQAMSLMEAGEYAKAFAVIDAIEEEGIPVARYLPSALRGDVFATKGEFEEASRHYAEALRVADPADPEYRGAELLYIRLKKEDVDAGRMWDVTDINKRARQAIDQMKASSTLPAR